MNGASQRGNPRAGRQAPRPVLMRRIMSDPGSCLAARAQDTPHQPETALGCSCVARRSINHVQVSVGRGTITLPWTSRQELLEESRRVEGMHAMRDAFETVGTSRPVSLTRRDKVGLVEVIDLWAGDTEGGFGGLPEGIVELRDALQYDL